MNYKNRANAQEDNSYWKTGIMNRTDSLDMYMAQGTNQWYNRRIRANAGAQSQSTCFFDSQETPVS